MICMQYRHVHVISVCSNCSREILSCEAFFILRQASHKNMKRDLDSQCIRQAAVQDQKVWGFTAKIQEEARHMDLVIAIIGTLDSMLDHVCPATLCTSLYLVFCCNFQVLGDLRITVHQTAARCEFG